MHTLEYYSAIKNETLPFATAWMDLEGIMLSKIRGRQIPFHSYLDFRKQKKTTTTKKNKPKYRELEVPRDWWWTGRVK